MYKPPTINNQLEEFQFLIEIQTVINIWQLVNHRRVWQLNKIVDYKILKQPYFIPIKVVWRFCILTKYSLESFVDLYNKYNKNTMLQCSLLCYKNCVNVFDRLNNSDKEINRIRDMLNSYPLDLSKSDANIAQKQINESGLSNLTTDLL